MGYAILTNLAHHAGGLSHLVVYFTGIGGYPRDAVVEGTSKIKSGCIFNRNQNLTVSSLILPHSTLLVQHTDYRVRLSKNGDGLVEGLFPFGKQGFFQFLPDDGHIVAVANLHLRKITSL